jgi:streptogramin lyase
MAAFDFENRLRVALREAAEREMQRGRTARSGAKARAVLQTTRRSFAPAAAAGLATALALVVGALFLTRAGSDREAVRPPEVVARLALGDSLGGTVGAYGSVWVADTGPDRLLRVDPDSRRVTVRLPVEGDVAMAPAGGTLWALNEDPAPAKDFRDLLLRIDPRSNEITARLRLRTPSGADLGGVDVAADQDSLWILGTTRSWHDDDALGLMRLAPQAGRATAAFALPGGWGRVGIALRRDGLWAITADDRLWRFDPRTGEKLSETPLDLPASRRDAEPAPGQLQFAGDTLVTSTPSGLAGIDPYAGRVVWRRHLGGGVNAWTEAGGLVWAAVSPQGPDRLFAVDPEDGHVATRVGLDAFGASGIASVGKQLWITTAGGEAVVLQR